MGHRFDSQAATYDQRAGLPGQVGREVAQAVLELAAIQAGDVVVEVGAGTGQIGQWLAQEAVRYVGFDLSPGMLHLFRQRLDCWGAARTLLVADGHQSWPIHDATASVIFSSRAVHLLPLEHVVAESFRVTRPAGATLLVGRLQRSPSSLHAQMKHQLHRLLRQYGLQVREGEQHQQWLLDYWCQCDAKVIAPVVVAQWRVVSTPEEAIAAWRDKPGLGGLDLSARLKNAILAALATWAETTFGGLQQRVESEAAYIINGVKKSHMKRSIE
jgi:ubiquinone/menaquinone biosynthesis C-methylase UbiE